MKAYNEAWALARELAAEAGEGFTGCTRWVPGFPDVWEVRLLRWDAKSFSQEQRVSWVRIAN